MTFDKDQAITFINGITRAMRRRAIAELGCPESADDESSQKKLYGDMWTFFHGVGKGVRSIDVEGSHYDFDSGSHSYSLEHWREEYEAYGYGAYGRGLEVGKRLAFYNERDYDFVESASNEEESPSFEFTHTE